MSKEKLKRCEDSLGALVKRLNFYEDQLKTMIHGMGLLLKDLNATKSEIALAMVTLKNNLESEGSVFDKTAIYGWARNRTKPFKMTRTSMTAGGFLAEYEGYRALGLHECAHCHTDIPETFEYDSIAYPLLDEEHPGFLCGRCHEARKK